MDRKTLSEGGDVIINQIAKSLFFEQDVYLLISRALRGETPDISSLPDSLLTKSSPEHLREDVRIGQAFYLACIKSEQQSQDTTLSEVYNTASGKSQETLADYIKRHVAMAQPSAHEELECLKERAIANKPAP